MQIRLLLILISCCATRFSLAEKNEKKDLIIIENEENESDSGVNVRGGGESFLDPNAEPFRPTNSWQKVKPGQSIPRGLHIRSNLATGETEAKLMGSDSVTNEGDGEKEREDSPEHGRLHHLKTAMEEAMKEIEEKEAVERDSSLDEQYYYWKDNGKEGMLSPKKNFFTRDELKHALKKFKASRDDVVSDKKRREKFRGIEEIRKDFSDLKMDFKTDLEILRELMEKYRRKDLTNDERIALLGNFEYYVHQFDNARNFADMGGLALVVSDLNSTDSQVRSQAAFVLGSACQSNPRVQIAAIDAGAMLTLVRILSTDASGVVRNRAMHALSALLRHFPYAQREFLRQGGLQTLVAAFARVEGVVGGVANAADNEKLRLKAVTLFNDLILERKHVTETDTDSAQYQERIRQYSQISVLDSLLEQGWCDQVPVLLQFSLEHDTREKVLKAMVTLLEPCGDVFSSRFSTVLRRLRQEYKGLAEEEQIEIGGEDGYFRSILDDLEFILESLRQNSSYKDEL